MAVNEHIPPVSERMIAEIAAHIAREFSPRKIILFGSHARGTASADSDIDLLVIMDGSGRPAQRALRILEKCRPRFVALDVLVRTPEEVDARLVTSDPFFRDIMSQGRVLYERSHA